MKEIILTDSALAVQQLRPLTFTRPIADLRVGILTIREKWEAAGYRVSVRTCEERLRPLFPELPVAEGTPEQPSHILPDGTVLEGCPDLFRHNGAQLRADYALLTAGRTSQPLPPSCRLLGPAEQLFIEEGALLEDATLNTTGGPIYIGAGAHVCEGARLRGPVAVCDHATVNMGALIYPDTTIGPWCKVGGELNNVVFQGYSNKAHDGYLGNAVVGHWCNLGAGCTSSNLKNDYSPVKLYSYVKGGYVQTDLQFCGPIIGDHSKAAINTSFNTATTIGVGCNIFGAGFPRTFIPSFSFGGPGKGFMKNDFDTFVDTARRVMARRAVTLTDADINLYRSLYDELS